MFRDQRIGQDLAHGSKSKKRTKTERRPLGRGVVSGLVWGIILSAVGVGMASLIAEQPPGREPPATPDTQVSEVETQEPQETPSNVPVDAVDAPQEAQPLAAPALTVPENLVDAPTADTQSAAVPQTGVSEAELAAPTVEEDLAVTVETDTPVLEVPQANEPIAPETEQELSISTEPAQPLAPAVTEDLVVVTPVDDTVEQDDDTQDVEIITETAEPAPTEGDAPLVVVEDLAPAAPTAPVVDETAQTSLADASDTADAPSQQPAQQIDTQTSSDVDVTSVDEDTPDSEAAVVTDTEETDLSPDAEIEDPAQPRTIGEGSESETGFGETVGSLTDRAAGVKVNRNLGTTTQADQTDGTTDRPMVANAESFENAEEKPVVSIVLIDDGSTPLSSGVLSSFSFPITFAVDAAANDASEQAQKYRDAGFEVLMMTNLPAGAQPSDIEVIMQAYIANVPQAVGILDTGENGFQDNRDTVEQVTDILAASGHGLLTQKQGLNTVTRAAERAEVPATTIYRDLDVAGQDARVISRFLDQAAFRAGQAPAPIVILGRTRPDTIAALLTWGVGQRASRLAFAPISAAME